MLNFRRIMILIGGLVVASCGYAVYGYFLGAIDTTRILPKNFEKNDNVEEIDGPGTEQTVDQKLAQSFGPNCEEKHRPLRLWIADKGIAFAAGDFKIEKNGKVKLAPFSAAMYHKSKAPGAFPEISTIRCDVALITLDRPVSNYSELNNRDVIGVELMGEQRGSISITNNRRTAVKNDDVDIRIIKGRLFYEKSKDLIWTDDVVCLEDYQSKPMTQVWGKGLQMTLAKGNNPGRGAKVAKLKPGQPANDNGNVEKIHLLADVDMHFWVDAKSGFLGGEPGGSPPAAPVAKAPHADDKMPPGKAHIHIKTRGPFVYDLIKETAWFESPPVLANKNAGAANVSIAHDQVHVQRIQKVAGEDTIDQLHCDRLDLQFRRKGLAMDNGPAATSGDKEIETAKAVRRDKNEVVLALDTEKMAAYGTELFYRAGDANNGPLTILKGEPLKTAKDGHKMWCSELHLFAANRAGEGQKAIAKGKGQIDLLDSKDPKKASWPKHVLWDDLLTIVKEKDGGRVYDFMTVTGDASFIDDQQKQQLHGETIMVWIEQLQESAKKVQASGGPRQELRRVLAIDRVRASSPEFIIRKANRLNMVFVPQLPPNERLPDVTAARPANEPKDVPIIPLLDSKPAPLVENKPAPLVENKPALAEKKAAPIELSGAEITGTVFTLGAKPELQDLIVKGNVQVHQPGDKPGEKRIDIVGQLLTIKYAEKGHKLVVHGDGKTNLARLEMGELILWGPIVTIDKGENRADVVGQGAMQMPSNKNLDGTDAPKDKKSTRVTIYWNKAMNFDGRKAEFKGGVQAYQQDSYSKLTCENMSAEFDKFISFKEGEKDNQSAKIDRIFCEKNVFVDDSSVDDKKQLVQRNILFGDGLSLYNLEGGTNLAGPGEVRVLAKGNASLEIAPPGGAPANNTLARVEWKLTHVKFRDRMYSDIRANTKNAIFRGDNSGVEVFHFATTDINAKMNADRPGKDQLYMRCSELEVKGHQIGDRTTQRFIAKYNVEFRTDKYFGQADTVKYDEDMEIVIFEGSQGNLVRLYQWVEGQAQQVAVKTTRVLYNRKTGQLTSDGVKSISN